MIIQREKMYFEPRVINESGVIRWYGERYTIAEDLFLYAEATVYIRDSGKELFIYRLNSDQLHETERIEATFVLISRISKTDCRHQYGRKIT